MMPFNHLGFIFKLFGALVYPAKARRDLADAVNPTKTGGAVLDIGSGTGILTHFVHGVREDLAHTCLDPAPGMLKYVPPYAHKVEGRAEELPFHDKAFDAILVGDALHHLVDPQRAIAEMMRCLGRTGVLFIFDMDPDKFMGRFICWLEALLNEPARFYTPKELLHLLIGHGYTVKIINYNWRYAIIAAAEKP